MFELAAEQKQKYLSPVATPAVAPRPGYILRESQSENHPEPSRMG